jgi:hypothetical protein
VDLTATDIASILGLGLAIISLFLLFVVEWEKRPVIIFSDYVDEKAPQSAQDKWYHLEVMNQEPWFFNRDAAMSCKARVNFLDTHTGVQLGLGQITSHWTNQPEPLDYTAKHLDPSKIPGCQTMDVGFRPEKFDVVRKYAGDAGFYPADPWKIYFSRTNSQVQQLRLNVKSCVLEVEVEAINLGKRRTWYYKLTNSGAAVDDISITRLPTKPPFTGQ